MVLTGLSNKQGDALAGRRRGRSRARVRRLPDRRASEEDRGRRHPGRRLDGSDRGRGTRRRDPARLAGAVPRIARSRSAPATRATAAPTPTRSRGAAPTTPLPMENNPRVVFERLFGGSDSTDAAASCARAAREDRSLLDAVTDKVSRLQRELGPRDRIAKLDRVSRGGPRRRAAHPEGRSAERPGAAGDGAARRHPAHVRGACAG